jgi:hypothetical protein
MISISDRLMACLQAISNLRVVSQGRLPSSKHQIFVEMITVLLIITDKNLSHFDICVPVLLHHFHTMSILSTGHEVLCNHEQDIEIIMPVLYYSFCCGTKLALLIILMSANYFQFWRKLD